MKDKPYKKVMPFWYFDPIYIRLYHDLRSFNHIWAHNAATDFSATNVRLCFVQTKVGKQEKGFCLCFQSIIQEKIKDADDQKSDRIDIKESCALKYGKELYPYLIF